MSRIGKLPIQIPKGVTLEIEKQSLLVKGPKGELRQEYLPFVSIEVKDDLCIVQRKSDSKEARSLHGLYRSLINNMVIGVSQGFSKTLTIIGVGYRAETQGDRLKLNLGYSSSIEYVIPEGLSIQTDGPNKISVNGVSKELVGKAAAEIRSLRPPEPYKGKGIRYENEMVIRKVGKSGVK